MRLTPYRPILTEAEVGHRRCSKPHTRTERPNTPRQKTTAFQALTMHMGKGDAPKSVTLGITQREILKL
jgi:hypothetical protein